MHLAPYVAFVGWKTTWGVAAVCVSMSTAACDGDGNGSGAEAETTGADAEGTGGPSPQTGAGEGTSATSSDPSEGTATTAGPSSTSEENTSSGGGDSTGAGSDTVPVFFAAGVVGRTTYSCDLGMSWTGNRSFDLEGDADVCGEVQPIVCYDETSGCQFMNGDVCETAATCDCDHHPGAEQGIAYGDGWWVATWGWGPPGSVRRSQDGMTWETVVEGTTFGGLAYGNGSFMAGSRQPRVSSDGGATWVDAAAADFQGSGGATIWNLRQLGFARAQGGHFIAIAADGDNTDILLSSDEGGSWWRPAQRPVACLGGNRGILSSEDTIVLLGSAGDVCTSGDGGQSWSTVQVGGDGPGVWDGTRFWWWGNGNAFSSVDGMTWDAQPMNPALNLGAVAVDPDSGVFVAVRGGWQVWYDAQAFYRSENGVEWATLDAGTFEGSHQIRHIAFARSASGVCR